MGKVLQKDNVAAFEGSFKGTHKVFPSDRFPDAIAAALHQQYGNTHGATNGESLIKLCRHSDQVLEAVLLLVGRDGQVKVKKPEDLRAILVQMLALIDDLEASAGR